MIDRISNNRNSYAAKGARSYDGFKNTGSLSGGDGSSDTADSSRVDNSKRDIAALRESITGSKNGSTAERDKNKVTHDFDEYHTSYLG